MLMVERSANIRRPALPLTAQLRVWHGYIGMFIAPTVLFMAATGILQIYSLHEAHAGYTPPPIIEQLARVHKDQVFQAPPHRESHDAQASARSPQERAAPPRPSQTATFARTAFKAFLAVVAGLLIVSMLIGVWMALRQVQRQRTSIVLLALGTVAPVLLVALTR
jgi:hypothetical protein